MLSSGGLAKTNKRSRWCWFQKVVLRSSHRITRGLCEIMNLVQKLQMAYICNFNTQMYDTPKVDEFFNKLIIVSGGCKT
jgi:hypothetical protein